MKTSLMFSQAGGFTEFFRTKIAREPFQVQLWMLGFMELEILFLREGFPTMTFVFPFLRVHGLVVRFEAS